MLILLLFLIGDAQLMAINKKIKNAFFIVLEDLVCNCLKGIIGRLQVCFPAMLI